MAITNLAKTHLPASSKAPSIADFWLRLPGNSQRFFRVKLYSALAPEEQTFARLLVGNIEAVENLIQSQPVDFFDKIYRLAQIYQLTRLIYDQVQTSGLQNHFPSDWKNKLRTAAFKETATHNKVQQQFVTLLKIFNDASLDVLFIKGVGLSQTAYSQPAYRCYGDFDIVVRTEDFEKLVKHLGRHQFEPQWTSGFCSQLGVGPTANFSNLILSPHTELIQTSVLALSRNEWPMIDIKISPIDRGIQMRAVARIFSDADSIWIDSTCFKTPNKIDHLMIMLGTVAKDRFVNWKNLLDVHFLSSQLSADDWPVLVDRCKHEGMARAAWAGLYLSADRFGTVVPNSVLDAIQPENSAFNQLMLFSTSPFYVWNANSLPTMMLSASCAEDAPRVWKLIRAAFAPSTEFLADYYNSGRKLSFAAIILFRVIHCATLLLPGGIVRRTYGAAIWPSTNQ